MISWNYAPNISTDQKIQDNLTSRESDDQKLSLYLVESEDEDFKHCIGSNNTINNYLGTTFLVVNVWTNLLIIVKYRKIPNRNRHDVCLWDLPKEQQNGFFLS